MKRLTTDCQSIDGSIVRVIDEHGATGATVRIDGEVALTVERFKGHCTFAQADGQSYSVPVEVIRPNASTQYCLHCPRCDARVRKLHRPPASIFACRRCHQLGYPSQLESASDRKWRR